MRIGRHLPRLTLLSCTLLFTTALEASGWKIFTSPPGGFSVAMPRDPERHESIHQSFLGPIRENTYSVTTEGGSYSVEYSDLPGLAVNLGGSWLIFNKAKEGVLKDKGGAETDFRSISLGKHPGRALSFHVPGKPSGKAHFFLVEKRLYVLVATSSSPANVETFLSSFKLLQTGTKETRASSVS
ncbi:MAG TPA: hypothetical protein VGW35_22770 [Methylomirabilota bacterium]|jgi:hypothetical protein|nr:hypothetical protein [Methylomirabilota bacterium]